MLEDFVNNKILWLFKEEYKRNPSSFIERISKKKDDFYYDDKNRLKTSKSLMNTTIFQKDKENKWEDIDEVFSFLHQKGYDFLGEKVIHNKKTASAYKIEEKSDLVCFIEILKDKYILSNDEEDTKKAEIFTKLEKSIAEYIDTLLKDMTPNDLLNVFNSQGLNLLDEITKNKLTFLGNLFPVSGNEKSVILLNVYESSVAGTVKREHYLELDDEGKKKFISGVLKHIDKTLLREDLKKSRDYLFEHTRSLLKEIKDDLTDREKSLFLKRIPQKQYYREISKVLGMRFVSKEFVGAPWARLIDFALYNREMATSKERSYNKNLQFRIDNAWISDTLALVDNPKFKDLKYREKDALFAYSSLYKYLYNEHHFFANDKSDTLEGVGFNLKKVKEKFKEHENWENFYIDSFNNDYEFRNGLRIMETVLKNFNNFFDKVDKNVMKTFLIEETTQLSSVLLVLNKNNISIEPFFNELAQPEKDVIFNKICKSYTQYSGLTDDVKEINNLVKYWKDSVLTVDLDSKEFSSVQANFKIVVNKIKMDVIMDKTIIDENPTDDVYKI